LSQIKVFIPTICEEEVKYSFEILLRQLCGLEIEFVTSQTKDFKIVFGDKEISIENSFFVSDQIDKLYSSINIPKSTKTVEFEIGNEKVDCELIYGLPQLDLKKQKTKIGIDVIGSTFFMLSRWEEHVIDKKDPLGRFDYSLALSVKNGFYERPVVNEYANLLYLIFRYMGLELPRNNNQLSVNITYDIDQLRRWFSPRIYLNYVFYNFSRGRIRDLLRDTRTYIESLLNSKKDPFNNLNFVSNSLNNRSVSRKIIYFKTTLAKSKYDKNRYDLSSKAYQDQIKHLKQSGFEFGLHPGFDAIKDESLMKREKENLEKNLDLRLDLVRQHYLRFEMPETFRCQVLNGFQNDSTMIYSHKAGFRNGICESFPVFDFLSREKISLTETPLLFMETPYMESSTDLINDFRKVFQQVQQFRGEMTILWHNGNLNYTWQQELYYQLLSEVEI
tara:strand:- start:36236 stop:37573 length:1338 start_codon:yes stop_codon:yes gene_type:complete